MESIYSVDSAHEISCVFTEILSQVDVTWNVPPVMVSDMGNLDIKQGTYDQILSQTSTLTLTNAQILKLKAASATDPAHVFNCEITIGTSKLVVAGAQTIKIYTPGIVLVT